MKVALVQFRSALLDRDRSLERVVARVHEAADLGADLVVFPEACVPGYPVWLSGLHGAAFEDPTQKAIHGRYVEESISPAHGHLESVCAVAAVRGVQVVLGGVERGLDRGGHTLYCTAFWIDAEGRLANVHRKLVPTHEERLCWGPGDGYGLRTRPVGEFQVGALNCWENWMPLARAAMQSQGLDVHLLLWPGSPALTEELTRVVAREGRCFAVSVGGVLAPDDLPGDVPGFDELRRRCEEIGGPMQIGGSCVAGPDGGWRLAPEKLAPGEEGVRVVDLDLGSIHAERQNFDVAGHYARPDVLQLQVDRRRQETANFIDDDTPTVTPAGTPLVDAIEHLVLTVRDPDHAARFYGRVLGFEDVRHEDDTRSLRFGSQRIELRNVADEIQIAGSHPTWGSADICLVSRAPIEEWLQHLRRFGLPIALGPVDRPGTTGPLRSIHFRDPDGNLIEIANRRPPRPAEAPRTPGPVIDPD